MQNVFDQLLNNSKERAALRDRLSAIQEELSQTRSELEGWTKEGFKLDQQNISSSSKYHITKLLENLSQLSKDIADDADADEMALNEYEQDFDEQEYDQQDYDEQDYQEQKYSR